MSFVLDKDSGVAYSQNRCFRIGVFVKGLRYKGLDGMGRNQLSVHNQQALGRLGGVVPLRKYESPTADFLEFEKNVAMESATLSQTCNCSAEQYDNNTGLTDYSISPDGCDLTSYGYIEIGDHY